MGIIIASASEIRGEVPSGCQALMKMPVLLSVPLNPRQSSQARIAEKRVPIHCGTWGCLHCVRRAEVG